MAEASEEKVPDPEVEPRPKRRQFTAEYKLRILREADTCKAPGEVGALLRREGLYSSHLVLWRRQREQAASTQLKSRKRGPKAKVQDPRIKQLERDKARLERRLKRAETIIEIQKNVHELLGIPLKNLDTDEILVQVMNENPSLFDKNDWAPGQGDFIPAELRVAGWRIQNVDGFIAALEAKLRSNGFCAYVEKGDILKVKSLAKGNILHEEYDVVQNPQGGGDYVLFAVKDRCHDAGF